MVQKLPSLQSERIVSQWLPCVLCWWGQLVFFQGLSLLTKTHRDESENQSIRKCLFQDNASIKSRLQQPPSPPPRQHSGIWLSFFQKGGELEPFLGGVGNLSEPAKSFQRNTRVLCLSMELLKGKEFTFAKRWLRGKGLQESYSHWSCILQKIVFEHNFGPGGREFERASL